MTKHELVGKAVAENRWPLVIKRPHWDDAILVRSFDGEWAWQRHGTHYYGKPKDDVANDWEQLPSKVKRWVNVHGDGTWAGYENWGEAEQAARDTPCVMVGVEVWLEE